MEKIAILGGGIGGLATAWELTSQPGWEQRFDITIHTLGWRLGGKCASSRGANGRIEEHGIHGFLGSYYNTLPMMAACYAELNRPKDAPLATFEAAFVPMDSLQMWEWEGRELVRWPAKFPRNHFNPAKPERFLSIEEGVRSLVGFLHKLHQDNHETVAEHGFVVETASSMFGRAVKALETDLSHGPDHPLMDIVDKAWRWLRDRFAEEIEGTRSLRRIFIIVDYLLVLIRGALADNVAVDGVDKLDDEDWVHWLRRHGAHELTINSPLAMNTINLSYQYPNGDAQLRPIMAAGAYLHWTLRSFAYCGAAVYAFAAGTGETVIAPLYEVLKRRGVKFEFFHKVEALRLSADKTSVAAIDIAVQATLKPGVTYDPLFDVKGLPCWLPHPPYEQLVEGDGLEAGDIDLESWWTPWRPVARLTLEAGQDYDRLVLATSIGTLPHIAPELLHASPKWQAMVDNLPAIQTQQVQIWLSKSMFELGWDLPLENHDTAVADTYLNPLDGQVEFRHIIPWEDWPAAMTPRSLWYFCGVMSDYEPEPPFSDHGYPQRMADRVKYQGVQYLQVSIGPIMPLATTDAIDPPGDPVGLDFGLLVDTRATPGVGIARFDSQFWRANIDPSERYVTSPPGSTKHRIKAWETGFGNLTIAGDWAYTGLNVGSVEGTVTSGMLCSHAIAGYPALSDIPGYFHQPD